MPQTPEGDLAAAEVAQRLAAALEQHRCEYALGEAIALGYWGEPRGTIDVDVTVYLPPDAPATCIELLQAIGCEVDVEDALRSLREHGFCRVRLLGVQVDVFLPTIPFYEEARKRRRRVQLGGQSILIWDAESLAVFKMMFFRRRDVADVEQILRVQGNRLDRDWVENQVKQMYGQRDPRVSQWRDLAAEIESD